MYLASAGLVGISSIVGKLPTVMSHVAKVESTAGDTYRYVPQLRRASRVRRHEREGRDQRRDKEAAKKLNILSGSFLVQ